MPIRASVTWKGVELPVDGPVFMRRDGTPLSDASDDGLLFGEPRSYSITATKIVWVLRELRSRGWRRHVRREKAALRRGQVA